MHAPYFFKRRYKMNEESLNIIVSQKREIDNLRDYVDAGFKVICGWGKKDHKSINFLSFCFGVMAFAVCRQNRKIKKLEMQINELNKQESVENKEENDRLEKTSAE